jgi:hypothetical protein
MTHEEPRYRVSPDITRMTRGGAPGASLDQALRKGDIRLDGTISHLSELLHSIQHRLLDRARAMRLSAQRTAVRIVCRSRHIEERFSCINVRHMVCTRKASVASVCLSGNVRVCQQFAALSLAASEAHRQDFNNGYAQPHARE